MVNFPSPEDELLTTTENPPETESPVEQEIPEKPEIIDTQAFLAQELPPEEFDEEEEIRVFDRIRDRSLNALRMSTNAFLKMQQTSFHKLFFSSLLTAGVFFCSLFLSGLTLFTQTSIAGLIVPLLLALCVIEFVVMFLVGSCVLRMQDYVTKDVPVSKRSIV